MNQRLKRSLFVITLVTTFQVQARNDQNTYPLADALGSPTAQQKLDPSVRLFFGDQRHPKPVKQLGEWKTNKKTNAFNKSEKEACEWVFLSAALELQERARKEGGNAVVNIRSNLGNLERSSSTEYQCANGALMAGVALKGTVVRLPH